MGPGGCEGPPLRGSVQEGRGGGKGQGGGGVLGLEKGTDCGPSAAELWLLRANNAKKGGLSSHYE